MVLKKGALWYVYIMSRIGRNALHMPCNRLQITTSCVLWSMNQITSALFKFKLVHLAIWPNRTKCKMKQYFIEHSRIIAQWFNKYEEREESNQHIEKWFIYRFLKLLCTMYSCCSTSKLYPQVIRSMRNNLMQMAYLYTLSIYKCP